MPTDRAAGRVPSRVDSMYVHGHHGPMEPKAEHAACGVGFVAVRDGKPSHATVRATLNALRCVEHRGAVGPDGRSSDGAGIMTDIPYALLGQEPGTVAMATLFVTPDAARRERALGVFEETFGFMGMRVLGYRDVPRNLDVLGPRAREDCPVIVQATLERPESARNDASFNAQLYRGKQTTRTRLRAVDAWMDLFFVSLSTTTVVYKALCRGVDLDQFYPDLANPRFLSRFGLFHRRFSTNTRTTWDKAQPFRQIAHNGEINTVAGNRSWANSRERASGLGRDELLTRADISDSGSLGEMVEALKYRSSLPYTDDILAIMVPAADATSDYNRFWGRAMEPWDGPALLAFSDGKTVGARLDRNGFRPARWCMTEDAFYLASEAGAFDPDPAAILAKGTLRAGSGVTVRLRSGKVHMRDPSEARRNQGATFDPRLVPIEQAAEQLHSDARAAIEPPCLQMLDRLALFGVTVEEVQRVLEPMMQTGKEPIGSMGNTARPALFSDQPRSLYDFFFQDFAQVTNPPLDYLREAMVTNLSTHLGRRPNIFSPAELIPPTPALLLEDPILSLEHMEVLRAMMVRKPSPLRTLAIELPTTYERAGGHQALTAALEALGTDALAAVRDGHSLIVLSDRTASSTHPPIPSLLALRSVVTTLNRHGHRLDASLVLETGEVRTTHALACAIGFGATAVCPRLAFELARAGEGDDREARLRGAMLAGLLKVMAKMGISVVRSYQSSKLFTPYGLGPGLVDAFFGTTRSPVGGLEMEQLALHLERSWAWADDKPGDVPLPSTYQLKERKKAWQSDGPEGGERHSMTAERSRLVHDLVRHRLRGRTEGEVWDAYEHQGTAVAPVHPRDLLDVRASDTPIPLDDVEPVSEIVRRFGSGAMSFGAISAESQRDIFVAMRSLGARCNSGEGGENPYYFSDGISATTKQIASGRFGVTAEYLVTGDEIEIKIAQGAKPGEGGQLMGVKVDAHIAKARFARPGVNLISPPPMHDIYSIEDLKQLIDELKQLSPTAAVCVKLVAGANVGTIACGVAKAGADVIQISGGDGGTGAAPITSMRHAGLPWELGLVDAHAQLVSQGLRDRVRLRIDGGLSTARDVVMAALLGAEEYGFGKALLIAQGCIMARVCEKNRCPTGIATHDPKFKAKYVGTPEHVVSFLTRLAEGVRVMMARLGARHLHELIGRRRWLQAATAHERLVAARGIDIGPMLAPVGWSAPSTAPAPRVPEREREATLIEEALGQLDASGGAHIVRDVRNTDRALASGLAGELARRAAATRANNRRDGAEAPLWPATDAVRLELNGSAGQGLAAFAVPGMHITVRGEANDGVAKSMSGGEVVVRPPEAATFEPERNAILGNGALYGATGGALWVHGCAGDRFAVRNSGATAVVEAVGLHACEYMTGGLVVVLGTLAGNAGAGMTGGRLFLPLEQRNRINEAYVVADSLDDDGVELLTATLRRYIAATGSRTARALLHDRSMLATQFVCAWAHAEPARAMLRAGA